jgi:drug/metabolite transporter (DMT)-like permease
MRIITCGSLVSDAPQAAPAPARLVLLTSVALAGFAANSILCRLALRTTAIDPASFTLVRLIAGAVTLLLLVRLNGAAPRGGWWSAAALFAYAACFSLAYVRLSAGTGALLLFGAVQATMLTIGLVRGERLTRWQLLGLAGAYLGLALLSWPGVSAPPLLSAVLMCSAGAAWGIYSLRAKGAGDALAVTAGNFVRTVPMALLLLPWTGASLTLDGLGSAYAIASGALASGCGYAVWYAALRSLRATTAATVQLTVPAITALTGVLLLGEAISLRLLGSATLILGGVATVLRGAARSRQAVE